MASYVGPIEHALGEPNFRPSTPVTQSVWFREIYRDNFTKVTRLILRFGLSHSDAEDLAHDVFVVVYRRRAEVELFADPVPWIRGVTLRVIRSYYRRCRVRSAARWLVEHTWLAYLDDDRDPERDAMSSEMQYQAGLVLRQMSTKLREAMVLLDVEGLSPNEASEILGVPRNTLRSRRALARQEFRRLWDLRMGEQSDG